METPPPVPPIEFDAPILDVFGSIFKLVRVVAVFCSLLLAGAGAVLAWNFYYFVTNIIEEPGQTVQKWQVAMAPVIQQSPIAPIAPAFTTTPTPVPPTAEAMAEPTSPSVAPVSLTAGTPPVDTPATPAHASSTEVTDASEPEVLNVPDAAGQVIPGQPDPDTKLVLGFADSVLERFQAGHFSWLLGMCFLAVFCWILGKVPGVMISVGAKVLVELLNADKPKPGGISGL